MDKDKMEEWQKLLKEAYGFSDEQLLEEFDRIKRIVDLEGGEPGNYEDLLRRIEKLEKKK